MNVLAALLFATSGSFLAVLAAATFGGDVPALMLGPLLITVPAAVCVAARRFRGIASIALWLHCGLAGLLAFIGASPFIVAVSVGLAFLGWHTERIDRIVGANRGEARTAILVRVIIWECATLLAGLALAGAAMISSGRLLLPFVPAIGTAVAALLLLAAGIRRGLSGS